MRFVGKHGWHLLVNYHQHNFCGHWFFSSRYGSLSCVLAGSNAMPWISCFLLKKLNFSFYHSLIFECHDFITLPLDYLIFVVYNVNVIEKRRHCNVEAAALAFEGRFKSFSVKWSVYVHCSERLHLLWCRPIMSECVEITVAVSASLCACGLCALTYNLCRLNEWS